MKVKGRFFVISNCLSKIHSSALSLCPQMLIFMGSDEVIIFSLDSGFQWEGQLENCKTERIIYFLNSLLFQPQHSSGSILLPIPQLLLGSHLLSPRVCIILICLLSHYGNYELPTLENCDVFYHKLLFSLIPFNFWK